MSKNLLFFLSVFGIFNYFTIYTMKNIKDVTLPFPTRYTGYGVIGKEEVYVEVQNTENKYEGAKQIDHNRLGAAHWVPLKNSDAKKIFMQLAKAYAAQ